MTPEQRKWLDDELAGAKSEEERLAKEWIQARDLYRMASNTVTHLARVIEVLSNPPAEEGDEG